MRPLFQLFSTKFYKITTFCLIIGLGFFVFFHQVAADYYQFTWTSSHTPSGVPPSTQFFALASNSDASYYLAAAANGRLYISVDGGSHWTETRPAGNTDKNWSTVAISDDGSILVAAVSGGRIYLSLDYGDNWAETQPAGNADKNWSAVVISDSGATVAAAVAGGNLYLSEDTGDHWSAAPAPINGSLNWASLAMDASGEVIIGGVQGGHVFMSRNGGDTWVDSLTTNGNWKLVATDPNGETLLAGASGGRLYTWNLATPTWSETQPAGATNQNWSAGTVANDGTTLFAAANPGRFYYSTNEGAVWYETQPDGSANNNWSAIVSTDNGQTVWAAHQTNLLFSGSLALAVPSAPANVTAAVNTVSLQTFEGYPVFKTTEVQNSGTSVFTRAHGNVQIGDKFYIGTRTAPAKVVVFNNPANLSDYDSVTVTGITSFESMTYDSLHHRIYAIANTGVAPQNLRIYSINPDNIHDYIQVVNDASLEGSGAPAIVTDGTYLYGGTNTEDATIFKYRIADWSLVATKIWPGASRVHGASLHIYHDRTEIYLSTVDGFSTIAKINGTDLSYQEYAVGAGAAFTDDIAFRYLDESGGILYAVSEVSNKLYALDTRTMTMTSTTAPAGYGVFIFNNTLYTLGINGYISTFTDFDFDSLKVFGFPGESPNEFFLSSQGRTFFTHWNFIGTGYIKEYQENSSLATTTDFRLSWTESTPETVFKIEKSANGVAYTEVVGDHDSTSYDFSDLLPGTQYWFRITAINGAASSTPTVFTATTAAFTPAPAPLVPSLVSVSTHSNQISLTWSGNTPQYLAKLGTTSSGWTSATSYTFSNLTCGQDYTIKVKGKNSDGVESAYQNFIFHTNACSNGMVSGGGGSTPPPLSPVTPPLTNENLLESTLPSPPTSTVTPTLPPVISPEPSTASSTAYTFKRNLMFGMRGSDVKELQKFLNNHGFPLAKSGVGSSPQETTFFGRLTRAAVQELQKSLHITPVLGNFGFRTRAAVNGWK